MMRGMLYEAAQVMLTRTNKWFWLKAWAMKIARHPGIKKAIIALARRLAVILHRIWVDGRVPPLDPGGRSSVRTVQHQM
jgi:transposase